MATPSPPPRRRATADAVGRHPHLAAPVPAGWVRVDLHSHTMWSGDSTTTPEELEQAVTDCGLDVLCITDHNAVKGAQELAGRLPCRVVVGEELRTHAGEIIGLFLTEHVPFGVSAGGGGAAHPGAGRAGLRAPPVRPDAAQPVRAGPGRADGRRPGRRHRGLQRQDLAAPPERSRRGLRRATTTWPRAPAATPTCPTPSARPTSRCPTSTDRPTSSPSCGRAGSSATTPIPTVRGGLASCRARRPEIPAGGPATPRGAGRPVGRPRSVPPTRPDAVPPTPPASALCPSSTPSSSGSCRA